MFVVVQFPIADARRFDDRAGRLLRKPEWPRPDVGIQPVFVRGFGKVVRRRQTVAPDDWCDEQHFAFARNALRLPGLPSWDSEATLESDWAAKCLFRRFFHDGVCVARVEIGFRLWSRRWGTDGVPDADQLVKNVLSLRSAVRNRGTRKKDVDLVLQGKALARLFEENSRQHSSQSGPRLVAAGQPFVVADMSEDMQDLPAGAHIIDERARRARRMLTHYSLTATPYGNVSTCYISRIGANQSLRRSIRLCALRLHAEEEALDHVLRWANDGGLAFDYGTPQGELLEDYVNRATNIVACPNKYGIEAAEMRKAEAAAIRTFVSARATRQQDKRSVRMMGLAGMRIQIQRKAETFLALRAAREGADVVIVQKGGHVSQQKQVITNSIINSPVVMAEKIDKSWSTFATQHEDEEDELTKHLAELSGQVKKLVANLYGRDQAAAQEATELFEGLTQEVSRAEPRAAMLRRIVQGLKEVATQVAEIAGPLAITTTAVLKALGVAG